MYVKDTNSKANHNILFFVQLRKTVSYSAIRRMGMGILPLRVKRIWLE